MFDIYKLILMGLGIGVLVAAPVGPVNVLCIQRALHRGLFAGIIAGLGAVIGDGLIALGAAFGLNAISNYVAANRGTLQVVGGVLLFLFGLRLFFTRPIADDDDSPDGTSIWLLMPQTFFLTITNPGAVLGMFALVGGAAAAFGGIATRVEALTLVLSIMAGSVLWWSGLSWMIARVRHKLDLAHMQLINRIGGFALMAFGAVLLLQLLASPSAMEHLFL